MDLEISNERINALFKKFEEEIAFYKFFFETEEFNEQIQAIINYGKPLDSEDLVYGIITDSPITAKQLWNLHFSISYALDPVLADEVEILHQYKGLVFRVVSGQGSILQVYKKGDKW